MTVPSCRSKPPPVGPHPRRRKELDLNHERPLHALLSTTRYRAEVLIGAGCRGGERDRAGVKRRDSGS